MIDDLSLKTSSITGALEVECATGFNIRTRPDENGTFHKQSSARSQWQANQIKTSALYIG
jgi:hypothetical protein